MYGTLVRSVKSGQQVFAECIQRIAIGERKDEIINVCRNEERMTFDSSAPAALKTDKGTSSDIYFSQAFVQGDLLPGDGHNGKVYISPPPGFTEDDGYVYQLRRPLYGMPSAARGWHTTMSAYLQSQGDQFTSSTPKG